MSATPSEFVTGELVPSRRNELTVNATPREFENLMRQADVLSRSGILPAAYRTTFTPSGDLREDKRPNLVVAGLTGRAFGWDILMAVRNIHVIEGAASLKPEAMLGMIRGRSHKVGIKRGTDYCEVTGVRGDNGDAMTARFTFEDAYRAGLARKGDDGMPKASSQSGKPLPWQQYPVDMCQWRAVAVVARGLFGDVVLGLGYTPDELGEVNLGPDGDIVNVSSGSLPRQEPQAPAEDIQDAEVVEERQAEESPAQTSTAPQAELRSDAQSKMMFALANKVGASKKEDLMAFIKDTIGHEIESTRDLTKVECGKVIDALEAAKQSRTDVVTGETSQLPADPWGGQAA